MTQILMETAKHLTRVFHPYWMWEENKYNMWGKVKNRQEYLEKAIKFTGDHELYGSFMLRVANEWSYSCEHNLSGSWQNKKAWIGHAACALAFSCPEDITRQAWGFLSKEQQTLANQAAERAIKHWEIEYAKNST